MVGTVDRVAEESVWNGEISKEQNVHEVKKTAVGLKRRYLDSAMLYSI